MLDCFLNAGQAVYTVIDHFCICKVINDVNNTWGGRETTNVHLTSCVLFPKV